MALAAAGPVWQQHSLRASATRFPASLLADRRPRAHGNAWASAWPERGAMPRPQRQFEQGQCATLFLVCATAAIFAGSVRRSAHAQHREPTQPRSFAHIVPATPKPRQRIRQHLRRFRQYGLLKHEQPLVRAQPAPHRRINSPTHREGEQGRDPTRQHEDARPSWKPSISRMQSSRIAASRSTAEACRRQARRRFPPMLIARGCWTENRHPQFWPAAWIVSSSRLPLDNILEIDPNLWCTPAQASSQARRCAETNILIAA